MRAAAGRGAEGGPAGNAGLTRYLLPFALVLALQGGFAVAVMVLDRANRSLPSDALYVVVVEAVLGASALSVLGYGALRRGRELARARGTPLISELPPAPPGPERAWRALLSAAREEAAKALASRDAAGRAEMEAFVASVHALKTPATVLSLMVQRSMAEGLPLSAEETGLEVEELCRVLDLAMGRLRLGDFESGSRLTRVDADEALRQSVKRHRRILMAKNVAVELRGEAVVETDRGWLDFILDQLVSNAAKYAASRVVASIARGG